MTKIWVGVLLSGILIFGCKAKKELVTNVPTKTNSSASAEPCADYDNNVIWSEYAVPEGKEKAQNENKKHKLLSVNERNLNTALIKNFQKVEGFKMMFPFLIEGVLECMEFELENSQTISKKMQKEMKIFSFRGTSTANAANTIRLDYSLNQGLKAYAFIDRKSYLLEPLKKGVSGVYITFAKADADAIKTKFEIQE